MKGPAVTEETLSPSLIRQLMRPGALAEDTAPPNLDDAQQRALHTALAALDAQDREILQLRYDANCTIEEIAAHLLTSPQIVEHREQDALHQLRQYLPPTREDIAASPTRRYVPAPAQKKPVPPTTGKGRAISEKQFAAYMAANPDATIRGTSEDLGISSATVTVYRKAWHEHQARHVPAAPAPQPVPLPPAPAPVPAPPSQPEPEPPTPTNAAYTRTLYEEQVYQARLWMEMLERQWREAKENAEEAVEYADTVQQRYLQAKANYERAQKIARAHYAMLHGQVVEELEG